MRQPPRPAGSSPGREPTSTGRSRVAVVAVTYSPGETLTPFLDSVLTAANWPAQGCPPLVVLADNGSTDGSLELAAGRDEVTVVRTGGNLGFGAAANAGVAALPKQVDWVLVCNPDLTFEPGAIDELMAATQRHPKAAALGPLLLTPQGQWYPSARELPSLRRGVGHAVFGWVWPANPWTKAYRRDHDEPVERLAGWLSGACVLLRRSAFEQIDGFDPGYFMFFEDVDLGARLARAGWESVYVPSARVTHLGGHSTKNHQNAMAVAHHASAYRYLARRYPARWQAPLRVLLKGGLQVRSAMAKRLTKVAAGAPLPSSRD